MRLRVALIAIAGAIIRIGVAPFTSWSADLVPWVVRFQEFTHGIPLYRYPGFSYPPLFAYLLDLATSPLARLNPARVTTSPEVLLPLSYYSSNLIAGIIPSPELTLAFKLPGILADLGIGLMLVLLARQAGLGQRLTVAVAAAWFFNPMAIWVSAVHGQFDAIPALATVLALAMVWHRQWLLAGAALSLGAMLKIYPTFLLPAVAAFVLMDAWADDRRGRDLVRTAASGLARLGVGFLVPILVFIAPLLGGGFINDVFSRAQTQIVGSGLDLWFPTLLPTVADSISQPWAVAYGNVLKALLAIGSVIVVLDTAFRWRVDRRVASVQAFVALLAIVLLTGSATNPQFMVWILPFLVLVWAMGRGYAEVTILLSMTPIAFYLAMWAGNPLVMLMPSIVYFGWPMPIGPAVISLTNSFTLAAGTEPIRPWLMFGVAALVVIELVAILASHSWSFGGWRSLPRTIVLRIRRPSLDAAA